MSEIFDKTPFAYVGENKHYKELTQEEKDELKKMEVKSEINKEALPSSEEVKESSASVIGQMIPQVGLTETEEPNIDVLFADVDEDSELLRESLEDTLVGEDLYFETAGFIEKLKDKFKKNNADGSNNVNHDKVMKAAKVYTALRMAGARVRIAVTKDPKVKNTSEYRMLQKKVIKSEKEYRAMKKGLNTDEVKALNQYIEGFEETFNKTIDNQITDIKDMKKIKLEYTEINFDDEGNEIVNESAAATAAVTLTGGIYAIMLGCVGYAIAKTISGEINMSRCTKLLKEKKSNFIDPKDMTVKRYKINRLITKIDKKKEVKNPALKVLYKLGDYMDVYSYKGKDIFAFSKTMDRGYYVDVSKLYFNMIDSSMSEFEMYYLSYACKKARVKVKEAYNWAKDFLKKNNADKDEKDVKESTDIVTEKNIDSDMKPLIEKLNKKGYKTLASSSGNNDLVAKDDINKNGVRDGLLYSDARLVFNGKYDLGKAPQYWYWKKVDNADEVDYLDIKQTRYITQPGGPSNAFQDWKRKYMRSLENWVDSLPDISNGQKEEVEESCTIESYDDINAEIDTLYESVLGDLMLDINEL